MNTPLTDILRGPSPRYKAAAVEAAVARREEATPGLLAILGEALADPGAYAAHLDADFGALYAAVLLAHLQVPEAHPLLLRLCRLPEALFEPMLGGFITEGMDRALFATCAGRTEGLRALASDVEAIPYLRSQAMSALTMTVHKGWADRAEVLAFLADLLVPDAAAPGGYFWSGVAVAMLRLHPVEHVALLQRAWDDGLISPMMMSRDYIATYVARGPEVAAAEIEADVTRALTPDVHAWMSWWACFRPAPTRSTPPSGPQARRAARAARKKARKQERSARRRQKKRR